jgi:signal transduction histidine kinase/ligand-binding sensor domain-containing protein
MAAQIDDSYIRADFTLEDGLQNNIVNAIVQTRNGLLWVGTDSGLASFDGREFTPIELHIPGLPAQGAVNSLVQGANGDLWVATNAGIAQLPNGILDQFDPSRIAYYRLGEGGGDKVNILYQTRDGSIWAGTTHGLYRLEHGRFAMQRAEPSVLRIAEASNGNLFLITNHGFVEWNGHGTVPHPDLAASLGVREDHIFNVFQDRRGTMWYATDAGIQRRGSPQIAQLQPEAIAHTPAFRTYEDAEGNVWIATMSGIYRVEGDRLVGFSPDIHARIFFVDRDGEVWIGTNGYGLIRLKRRIVRMYTRADGLATDIAMTVMPSREAGVWVGENCGLVNFQKGQFKTFANKADGLANTCVWSIVRDASNDMWLGTWGGGLLRYRDGHFSQFSKKEGLVSDVVLAITVAHDNSLWLATEDGISHMREGRFENYTIANGLSSNQVFDVYQDHAGRIWAATQGGIDYLEGTAFVPLTHRSDLYRPLSVQFAEDSLGDLYTLNSPKGVGVIKQDKLVMVNEDLAVWNMVESAEHELWFSGTDGVIRIARDELRRSITDHTEPLAYARFDRADGFSSLQSSHGTPNIAIGQDQMLWVATVKGLAAIDLAHLTHVSGKPRIFLGDVLVDKDKVLAGNTLTLPPGTHHVELHLKAVDLASPEKIRLQYRMDGVDSTWLDANAARTVVYTSIPPGSHAFHVRASSSDGEWDRTGIVYHVTQEPYYYQTMWFRFVALGAILFLLYASYLVRVRQIVQQTQIRVEERLVERERIARELHDTLLQGFYGLMLRLNKGVGMLGAEDPAKPILDDALMLADRVLEEGRDKVQNLRLNSAAIPSLKDALAEVVEGLMLEPSTTFSLHAVGAQQPLNHFAFDEIFAIGREAMVNVSRHASASTFTVELRFEAQQFTLRCEDDGCGLSEAMVGDGAGGRHFGLVGMRERSRRLGAELKISRAVPTGTSVVLIVPGRIAYPQSRKRWSWFSRLNS